MFLLLGFCFLAGVFTALSPCILPILPAILASSVGQGKLRPLGTILGLVGSFSFFTLALSWVVHVTGLSPEILRYFAIAFIFFFGLVMLWPRLSNWFAKTAAPIANLGQKIQGTKARPGFWGGIFFGIALGLLWTPCAGPILGAITTLVATGSITFKAVLMTLAYSVGAGIPLFIFAYGGAKLVETSHFLSSHSERIRQFFGVLMIAFALILTFHWEMLINEKISRAIPEFLTEKNLPSETKTLPENGKAPELVGITGWINSPPLTLSELKGKVVLIDFWTYSCINCLRTLPYLKNWYADYKNYGFVIIGVHTPEFAFEKDYDNVKKAARDLSIDYPIALDNNYATWNAYDNRYWPAHYLIDQNGVLRMEHFGEGGYEETENAIRQLLGLEPLQTTEKNMAHRPISPETYLGLERGNSYAMHLKSGENDYAYSPPLGEDEVGLKGPWRSEDQFIEARGDNCYLDYNFLATRVYLVLSGTSPVFLEIYLDGKFYGSIHVGGDRKYDIVRAPYGRHLLSLKVPQGIKAYAFTFGDE
ncbi:MAG: cytochrome c biogenesis protein DipZ [Verrucomicrobia bacterium]|nr:cytochrome c biogenesis protein DipZ [Verrucomicrobiota bacterium]